LGGRRDAASDEDEKAKRTEDARRAFADAENLRILMVVIRM
jgi:hypothetical protein